MRISILACLALPVVSFAARASAAPCQGTDLKDLLATQVAAASTAPTEELWRRASALRDAARELQSTGLDTEIDHTLATPNLTEGAQLMLCGLRLEGTDPDATALSERLRALLESKREDIAVGAAGLLADPTFRTLSNDDRRSLVERLLVYATDGQRSPQLRLETAFAASKLGGGDDLRKARAQMTAFMESNDASLRALGALTLARSGAEISGKLYDELRTLAILPGERGRLAASYLEKERVRELGERKLKNLSALNDADKGAPAASDKDSGGVAPSELDPLRNLLVLIERAHLDGDKVTRDQLLEAAMQGMLSSLDEHSTYLNQKNYTRFEQDLAAGYGGIGAYVGEDREDGLFTITHPIYSGPAYKAGLMSEDKIVRIDDWPTIGKPVDEIIKRLKGKPGTPVKLYVWRRGMDPALADRPTEDMVVSVERQAITIPAEQHQLLPGKIGVLVLHEFSQVASSELRKPLLAMLDSGMQGLVFDLRNNSGGLLEEAVNVAGLFLPRNSLVVSTESRVRETEKLYTQNEPIVPANMPIVVLVNRFSASASEIVSGALQDHGRATIIGQRSFGKGSVQNLIPLTGMRDDRYEDENKNGRWDNWEKITKDWNNNGEFDFAPRIKLTIARYLLPSGRSIHREVDKDANILSQGGIEPDKLVAASRTDMWRIEEMYRVNKTKAPRDWVERNWGEYKERFGQIADNDRKDTSIYPGFQELYDSLHTPLPPDDVRQLLRAEIRRRVQDTRGQEFPQGDFVEDLQLQAAISDILAKLGTSPDNFPDYKATIAPATMPHFDVAMSEQRDMRDALDALKKALKGDRKLSEPALNELVKLLESNLKN